MTYNWIMRLRCNKCAVRHMCNLTHSPVTGSISAFDSQFVAANFQFDGFVYSPPYLKGIQWKIKNTTFCMTTQTPQKDSPLHHQQPDAFVTVVSILAGSGLVLLQSLIDQWRHRTHHKGVSPTWLLQLLIKKVIWRWHEQGLITVHQV